MYNTLVIFSSIKLRSYNTPHHITFLTNFANEGTEAIGVAILIIKFVPHDKGHSAAGLVPGVVVWFCVAPR